MVVNASSAVASDTQNVGSRKGIGRDMPASLLRKGNKGWASKPPHGQRTERSTRRGGRSILRNAKLELESGLLPLASSFDLAAPQPPCTKISDGYRADTGSQRGRKGRLQNAKLELENGFFDPRAPVLVSCRTPRLGGGLSVGNAPRWFFFYWRRPNPRASRLVTDTARHRQSKRGKVKVAKCQIGVRDWVAAACQQLRPGCAPTPAHQD